MLYRPAYENGEVGLMLLYLTTSFNKLCVFKGKGVEYREFR